LTALDIERAPPSLRTDNNAWEDKPRIPAHNPGAGEWTSDGTDGSLRSQPAETFPAKAAIAESGGTYGKAAMYRILITTFVVTAPLRRWVSKTNPAPCRREC
jgi:hypothetical protein